MIERFGALRWTHICRGNKAVDKLANSMREQMGTTPPAHIKVSCADTPYVAVTIAAPHTRNAPPEEQHRVIGNPRREAAAAITRNIIAKYHTQCVTAVNENRRPDHRRKPAASRRGLPMTQCCSSGGASRVCGAAIVTAT